MRIIFNCNCEHAYYILLIRFSGEDKINKMNNYP